MTIRPVLGKAPRSWALFGAAIGACVPLIYLGPELVRRMIHVGNGGQGETANWGEPFFYFFVIALPLTAIGYVVGKALDANRR
jgi:hypothetical protein